MKYRHVLQPGSRSTKIISAKKWSDTYGYLKERIIAFVFDAKELNNLMAKFVL